MILFDVLYVVTHNEFFIIFNCLLYQISVECVKSPQPHRYARTLKSAKYIPHMRGIRKFGVLFINYIDK